MSYFIKNGSHYTIAESRIVETLLPTATYSAKQDPRNGQFYLEIIEGFEPVKKIYGNLSVRCDKILRTYFDRPVSTGVLLAGEKGSGKSLLVKQLSIQAAKNHDLPTILISSPLLGEDFNKFIQNIEQRCLVIFDEFEKVYARSEHQQQLLTLLDGVFTTSKLFLFTVNNKWALDKNFQNRPGRIFYSFDYVGLDENFIREYCEDVLNDKTHVEEIINISDIFDHFNFDMLKALVEETNRYSCRPSSCIEDLNIKPEYSLESEYSITLFDKHGNLLKTNPKEVSVNPMNADLNISIYTIKDKVKNSIGKVIDEDEPESPSSSEDDDDDEDEEGGNRYVEFEYKDMNSVDRKNKSIVLINDQGYRLLLKKIKHKTFNWKDSF